MQLEVSLFVASFFNAIGGDWKALQADSEQAMQVSTYQKVFQVEACRVSIPPAAIFPLTTHLTTAASTPNLNQIHGGKHAGLPNVRVSNCLKSQLLNCQTYQGELSYIGRVSNCQKSQGEIPNAKNLRESFHMPDISGRVSNWQKSRQSCHCQMPETPERLSNGKKSQGEVPNDRNLKQSFSAQHILSCFDWQNHDFILTQHVSKCAFCWHIMRWYVSFADTTCVDIILCWHNMCWYYLMLTEQYVNLPHSHSGSPLDCLLLQLTVNSKQIYQDGDRTVPIV